MGVIRLHKLIAEPGSTLMAYEEAKWADALDYQNQDVEDGLQIFKLTRQTTYHLLKNLSNQAFTHSVSNSLGEPYTFEKWLDIYSLHVPEHIVQLKKT